MLLAKVDVRRERLLRVGAHLSSGLIQHVWRAFLRCEVTSVNGAGYSCLIFDSIGESLVRSQVIVHFEELGGPLGLGGLERRLVATLALARLAPASCFCSGIAFLLGSYIAEILVVLALISCMVFAREELEFSEMLFCDDLPEAADLLHHV